MCSSPSLFDFCRVRSVSRISACRGTGEFATPHFGASAAGRCRKDFPSVDELSASLIGQALGTLFKDSVPHTRGAKDILLFKKVAPSVVWIRTKDSLGSGTLLSNNTILTNRHVVGNERQVTVVFKPSDPSGKPKDDEVVQADVIKLDSQRDLALLRPAFIPSRRPLDISAEDGIDVGTDVGAIGHPTGEAWTFTKGIVSAVRPDYEWLGGPNDSKHIATVIQTQTPINPGNSGGPLLIEDGKLIGVNSFRTPGAEGYDRMPVFLAEQQFAPWLSGEAGAGILKPVPNDYLQRWPVSKRVNSSKADADDATLIEPVEATVA